jgi:hypothetical protein
MEVHPADRQVLLEEHVEDGPSTDPCRVPTPPMRAMSRVSSESVATILIGDLLSRLD